MKYCTNCGNKLPDNAAMCVKCGNMIENVKKPSKKKKFPAWAIVLIAFGSIFYLIIGFIVLLAVIFTSDEFDEVIDELPDVIVESGVVGDTLYTDKYQITLTDAKKYDSIGDNEIRIDAEDGKEYLVLFFDIKNITSDNLVVSDYDFSGYVDEYIVPSKHFIGEIDGYKSITNNLKPKAEINGYIVYELDKDWNSFKIYVKDGLLVDEDVYFEVFNENRIKSGL